MTRSHPPRRTLAPLALLVAACLATPAAARTSAQDTSRTPAQAKDLVGKDIADATDATLGTITDLAFGTDGTVVALARRPDGRVTGVPLDEIEAVRADEAVEGRRPIRRLTLRSDRETFDQAPTMAAAESVDRPWLERVQAHFKGAAPKGAHGGAGKEGGHAAGKADEVEPYERDGASGTEGHGDDAGMPAHGRAAGDMPGHDADKAASPAAPPLLSTIVGIPVENGKGEQLGHLSGIAIDVTGGKVAYAILTVPQNMFGLDERHHGAPWSALHIDASDKVAKLSINRSKLEDMPGIDLKALPSHPDLPITASPPVSLGSER